MRNKEQWRSQRSLPALHPSQQLRHVTTKSQGSKRQVLIANADELSFTCQEEALATTLCFVKNDSPLSSERAIIDEIGYLPIDRQGANLFFQLVSRRYERGSIIITSNQSLGAWGEVFGDQVIASAILDRLSIIRSRSTSRAKASGLRKN
jgi:hypothetical protein